MNLTLSIHHATILTSSHSRQNFIEAIHIILSKEKVRGNQHEQICPTKHQKTNDQIAKKILIHLFSFSFIGFYQTLSPHQPPLGGAWWIVDFLDNAVTVFPASGTQFETSDITNNLNTTAIGIVNFNLAHSFLSFFLLYRHYTMDSLGCKKNLEIFMSRDFDKTFHNFLPYWHTIC
jgi:hypothetical protein